MRDRKNLHGQLKDRLYKAGRLATRPKAASGSQFESGDWEAIFDSIRDFVWVQDKDFRILRANKAFAGALGMKQEDLAGRACYQVVHETGEPQPGCPGQQAVRLKKTVVKEFFNPHLRVYLQVSTFPRIDEHGEVTGCVHICRDITGEKQAAEKLKTSEEKHRLLINRLPDVIWTADSGRKTTYISPNVERIYGYAPGEIYRSGDSLWLGRIHPDDVESVKKAYAALFQNRQEFRIKYRIQRKDGRWIWLLDRAVEVYEKDGRVYADGIFSDITEQKEMAEELWRLRSSRDLLQGISLGLFIFQYKPPDFLTLGYANAEAERLTGINITESLGKEFFMLWPHPGRKSLTGAFLNVIQNGKHYQTETIYYSRKGDRLGRFFQIHAFPLPGKRIAVTFEDVTARKKTEQALRDSEERYHAIFEQAADSIVLIDPETGALVDFNEKAYKNLGYTREEFRAVKLTDIEVTKSLGEIARCIQEVIRNGCGVFKSKHRTKSGEIRDVRIDCRLISVGGKRLIQSVWRDSTGYRTEKVPPPPETSLQPVPTKKEEFIYTLDLKGNIISVDDGLKALLGVESHQAVGENFVRMIPRNLLPQAVAAFKRVLRGKEVRTKTIVVDKDGITHAVEFHAAPLIKDGKAVGVKVSMRECI